MVVTACEASPLQLDLFAAGSRGKRHYYVAEGASVEVQASRRWGLLFKGTGNHILTKRASINPYELGGTPSHRHHFARFQAGLMLDLDGLSMDILGGRDAWGSRAYSVEGGLSWWMWKHSYHPVRMGLSAATDDKVHIWSEAVTANIALARRLGMLWFLTASGQAYQGAAVQGLKDRLTGGFSVNRISGGWGCAVSVGGGSYGEFSQIALFQSFGP